MRDESDRNEAAVCIRSNNLVLTNCLFVLNDATNKGGGLWISGIASVESCTFSLNKSGFEGGGIGVGQNSKLRIANSVLWGNYGTDLDLETPWNKRVRTSCLEVQATSWPSAGNIDADPKFVNAAAGDLRLQSGSPCIDAGNNYIDYYPTVPGFQLLPATDLDGLRRVVDGNLDGRLTVDMGSYERQGP